MVSMLGSAYDATENSNFLTLQRRAFDWFLGENDLHTQSMKLSCRLSIQKALPATFAFYIPAKNISCNVLV